MNIINPNSPEFRKLTLPEAILKFILSNIKGTLEHSQREMNKNVKY